MAAPSPPTAQSRVERFPLTFQCTIILIQAVNSRPRGRLRNGDGLMAETLRIIIGFSILFNFDKISESQYLKVLLKFTETYRKSP